MAPKKRKYDEADSFVNCPVRGCKMRVDEAKLQAHILEKHAKSQAAREIKEKQALAGEAKGPPCVPCDMEVCGDAAPVAPAAPAASTGSAARREADRLSAFTAPWRSLVGAGRVETLKAFDGFRLFVAARVCAVLYQRVIFHC
eukprot:s10_g3.t1